MSCKRIPDGADVVIKNVIEFVVCGAANSYSTFCQEAFVRTFFSRDDEPKVTLTFTESLSSVCIHAETLYFFFTGFCTEAESFPLFVNFSSFFEKRPNEAPEFPSIA